MRLNNIKLKWAITMSKTHETDIKICKLSLILFRFY